MRVGEGIKGGEDEIWREVICNVMRRAIDRVADGKGRPGLGPNGCELHLTQRLPPLDLFVIV
jgi:hypothetical protein